MMKEETPKTVRWKERLAIFAQALSRLADVVSISRERTLNEFERDSLVKRFEFTYEMAWKLMMSYEKDNGITQIAGSRDVIRHAAALTLIDNGEAWMDMVDERNQTSHLYDEAMVADITDGIIHTDYPLFVELQRRMEQLAEQ